MADSSVTTNPTPGNPPRPKVLVTSPLPGRGLERLQATTDLHCWDRSPGPAPEQLRTLIRDCEGLLCILTDTIDQALLDCAPRLRVVSSCSVGVDHVDVRALSDRGIPLGHTPGVLTDATADLAIGLLLACARRITESDRFVRAGDWTPNRRWSPGMMLGMDLQGATLGLIGLGPIGQAVARRAQGFGLRVVGWTPSGRSVPGVTSLGFTGVLEQSDILSLHLALSERSRRIIDRDALHRLRKGALLINTARGGLVDEAALVHALQDGSLAGAGLDVFEQEPLPARHPLLTLPNVVMTPHIGSATRGTRTRMADLAVDNLLAGLRGEPLPFCANREPER